MNQKWAGLRRIGAGILVGWCRGGGGLCPPGRSALAGWAACFSFTDCGQLDHPPQRYINKAPFPSRAPSRPSRSPLLPSLVLSPPGTCLFIRSCQLYFASSSHSFFASHAPVPKPKSSLPDPNHPQPSSCRRRKPLPPPRPRLPLMAATRYAPLPRRFWLSDMAC